MKKMAKFLSIVFALCTACSLCACGGDGPAEGQTEILFSYEADAYTNPVMYRFVKAYNDTQGKIDGVYVKPDQVAGIGTSQQTFEGNCSANVIMTDETVFKKFAISNLFLNLDGYEKQDNYDFSGISKRTVDSARITLGTNGSKTYAGDGQELYGMPFMTAPAVLYYNTEYFDALDINVVSCEEGRLSTQYPNLQPHGYAEYTAANGAAAPFEGAKKSTNLAGKEVYKVFNNRIAMNYEEFRYLSKMFTKEYNSNSPSDYSCYSEWWFNDCWSVGGDCIGFDGEKYLFTLFDDKANYLATKDVTVNGKSYQAGEVIRYEDKVNEQSIASLATEEGGLCELPSQYDVQLNWLRYAVRSNQYVESVAEGGSSDIKGYGLYSPDHAGISNLLNHNTAMSVDTSLQLGLTNRQMAGKFNIAPLQQYRKFVNGSTYYDGGNDLAHEYIKVIGEKNGTDTEVYTGALATENGTKIVGTQDSYAAFRYLVIPKNSSSEKYDAAWKFISWAGSEEGQKTLADLTCFAPVNYSVAFGDYTAKNTKWNSWVIANASKNADIADWAYFENGEWVNAWSGNYNDVLREGVHTIKWFLDNNKTTADRACANTSIVIKGRR